MTQTRLLSLTMETVTPLFLGGAEPRETPELRAPSLRGAMRQWARAILGNVIGDSNLTALHQAESAVFGSTGGVSPIVVRIPQKVCRSDVFKSLPHKPPGDPRGVATAKGFVPGETFQVILDARQTTSSVWHIAIASLVLTTSIGGLGRRSRRGFGSLRIDAANVSNAALPESWQKLLQAAPQTATEWEHYLREGIELARVAAREHATALRLPTSGMSTTPQFSILSDKSQIVVCGKVFPDWLTAIKAFGEAEHEFIGANPSASNSFGSANPRWASPLWVRILPVEHGVILAMILLWSQPAPGLHVNPNLIQPFIEARAGKWDGRSILTKEVMQ